VETSEEEYKKQEDGGEEEAIKYNKQIINIIYFM
jgi:hypothetical protein